MKLHHHSICAERYGEFLDNLYVCDSPCSTSVGVWKHRDHAIGCFRFHHYHRNRNFIPMSIFMLSSIEFLRLILFFSHVFKPFTSLCYRPLRFSRQDHFFYHVFKFSGVRAVVQPSILSQMESKAFLTLLLYGWSIGQSIWLPSMHPVTNR